MAIVMHATRTRGRPQCVTFAVCQCLALGVFDTVCLKPFTFKNRLLSSSWNRFLRLSLAGTLWNRQFGLPLEGVFTFSLPSPRVHTWARVSAELMVKNLVLGRTCYVSELVIVPTIIPMVTRRDVVMLMHDCRPLGMSRSLSELLSRMSVTMRGMT